MYIAIYFFKIHETVSLLIRLVHFFCPVTPTSRELSDLLSISKHPYPGLPYISKYLYPGLPLYLKNP